MDRAIPRPLWIAIPTLALLIVNGIRFLFRIPFFHFLGSPDVRPALLIRLAEIVLCVIIIWGFFKSRRLAWILAIIAAGLANYVSLSRVKYASLDLPVLCLVLLPVLSCSRWFFTGPTTIQPTGRAPALPENSKINGASVFGFAWIAAIFVLYFIAPTILTGEFIRLFYYALFAGAVYAIVHEIHISRAFRHYQDAGKHGINASREVFASNQADMPDMGEAQSSHDDEIDPSAGDVSLSGLSTQDIVIVLIGLVALIVPEYFALRGGYNAGLKNPGETLGNIVGILIPVFGIIQIVLILRISIRWGRVPVGGALGALVLITLVQLPLSYMSANIFGQGTGWSMQSRVRANLRIIAAALERYQLDNRAYPSTLNQLAPSHLKSLPEFPLPYGPLRYTVPGTANGNASEDFLLWVPGPNGKRLSWAPGGPVAE